MFLDLELDSLGDGRLCTRVPGWGGARSQRGQVEVQVGSGEAEVAGNHEKSTFSNERIA